MSEEKVITTGHGIDVAYWWIASLAEATDRVNLDFGDSLSLPDKADKIMLAAGRLYAERVCP